MNSQNFGPGDNRQIPVKEALSEMPAEEKRSTLSRWRDSLKKLTGATWAKDSVTPDSAMPDSVREAGDNRVVQLVAAPGSDLEREELEDRLSEAELEPAEQEGPDCPVCGFTMELRPGSNPPLYDCPDCGACADEALLAGRSAPVTTLDCPNCGLNFDPVPLVGEALANCPRCGLMIAAFETFREENARLLANQAKDAADFRAAVLPPKMVKRRLAQALHALDTAIDRLEEVRRHELDTGQWPGKALNTMLADLEGERERLFGYAERRYKVKKSVLRAYR